MTFPGGLLRRAGITAFLAKPSTNGEPGTRVTVRRASVIGPGRLFALLGAPLARLFPRFCICESRPWHRYEKPQPGHRLQIDVKFLERIAGSRKRLYQFTAIDDCTRIRVLKIYDVCNQKSAISFVDEVIRRLPFRVLVIQTDNGAEFQSNFHWHLEEQDIRHVYIRPRTPRLNGKVERSHRVDEQEFYQLLDKNGIGDDIHLFNDKLREWEDYYNYYSQEKSLLKQGLL
jgi:transposase InsO family protein